MQTLWNVTVSSARTCVHTCTHTRLPLFGGARRNISTYQHGLFSRLFGTHILRLFAIRTDSRNRNKLTWVCGEIRGLRIKIQIFTSQEASPKPEALLTRCQPTNIKHINVVFYRQTLRSHNPFLFLFFLINWSTWVLYARDDKFKF